MPVPMRTDAELARLIGRLRFVDDPTLAVEHPDHERNRLGLIEYFVDAYQNTDQDTVLFAAEAFVVIRTILAGQRPVRLEYLTDFEGELK